MFQSRRQANDFAVSVHGIGHLLRLPKLACKKLLKHSDYVVKRMLRIIPENNVVPRLSARFRALSISADGNLVFRFCNNTIRIAHSYSSCPLRKASGTLPKLNSNWFRPLSASGRSPNTVRSVYIDTTMIIVTSYRVGLASRFATNRNRNSPNA